MTLGALLLEKVEGGTDNLFWDRDWKETQEATDVYTMPH